MVDSASYSVRSTTTTTTSHNHNKKRVCVRTTQTRAVRGPWGTASRGDRAELIDEHPRGTPYQDTGGPIFDLSWSVLLLGRLGTECQRAQLVRNILAWTHLCTMKYGYCIYVLSKCLVRAGFAGIIIVRRDKVGHIYVHIATRDGPKMRREGRYARAGKLVVSSLSLSLIHETYLLRTSV